MLKGYGNANGLNPERLGLSSRENQTLRQRPKRLNLGDFLERHRITNNVRMRHIQLRRKRNVPRGVCGGEVLTVLRHRRQSDQPKNQGQDRKPAS